MPDPTDSAAPIGDLDTLTANDTPAAISTGQLQTVGRFEIRAQVGAGGMGVVYRAHDPSLEREVALKLLHPDATRSPERRARLLREARAMAKIAHPNVIHVYEVGSIGEQDFVAMELVGGPTLAGWLKEDEREWRDVLRVFLLAGRGLQAAHAKGLVHRDFKPSNVLLTSDDRVMVTDFGLAVAAREDQAVPPDGTAVARAEVVAAAGELAGDGNNAFGSMGGTREWQVGLRRSFTDEDGVFVLLHLPNDGTLCVVAEQEAVGRSAYARLTPADGDSPDLDLTLHPYGSVRGVLGPPVESPQQLHLHALPATADGDPWACRLEIPIAPDGSYRIPRLPAVRHRIVLVRSHEGHQSVLSAREVEVKPGDTAVANLEPPPAGTTLAVEVRSSAAVAVESAAIVLLQGRVSPLPKNGAEVMTTYGLESVRGDTRLDYAAQDTGTGTVAKRFEQLRAGDYTLCGAATPGDLRDPALREKLWAHRHEIAVICEYITVTGSAQEQRTVLELPPMARLSGE